MEQNIKRFFPVFWAAMTLAGLYFISMYNYFLFHSLAEIFSAAVALALFMIIWNSQKYIDNNYLLIIGIAYLFIGGLGMLHTLSYPGMSVFKNNSDYSIQLWIAERYLETITFLLAFASLSWKRINAKIICLGYAAVFTLIMLAVFYWRIFPTCYIEGNGLTAFKIGSEYINCLIILLNIWLLRNCQEKFEQRTFEYLLYSLLFNIVSGILFTLYTHPEQLANIVGHYFRILSFYLIYKAIIQTAVESPYAIIFRELVLKECSLKQQAATDELTGLLNRRAALALLEEMMSLAKKEKGPLTVCFIDMDCLKQINDCHGHLKGDLVITATAKVIKEAIRGSDYLCRIGGDEFLLILPGCTVEEAKFIIERAKASLSSLKFSNEQSLRVDFSYGFATYDWESSESADELIEKADKNMYKNKSQKDRETLGSYQGQVVSGEILN